MKFSVGKPVLDLCEIAARLHILLVEIREFLNAFCETSPGHRARQG